MDLGEAFLQLVKELRLPAMGRHCRRHASCNAENDPTGTLWVKGAVVSPPRET